MNAKTKFYVVWKGRKTGVFKTWEECALQINGFQGALYRAYSSMDEAKEAFIKGYSTPVRPKGSKLVGPRPTENSICVDAACSVAKMVMEYRGVFHPSGKVLFHKGPFNGASNNIGEFLAIVHALSYMQKANINFPVYSDSVTAIAWVKKRRINTKIDMDPKVIEMTQNAVDWLNNNTIENFQIRKWETSVWGEIPADFGRK